MRRFFVLPQLLAAPLLAGSLFLAPPSMANSHQGSSQYKWLSDIIQLLFQSNGTLPALALGSPIAFSLLQVSKSLSKTNELNSKIPEDLDIIKDKLNKLITWNARKAGKDAEEEYLRER